MLSRGDPLSEKLIEAIVSDRRRDSIRVVLKETPSDIRKDTWRMDRGANRIAYDRMRDSLEFNLPRRRRSSSERLDSRICT